MRGGEMIYATHVTLSGVESMCVTFTPLEEVKGHKEVTKVISLHREEEDPHYKKLA
jgi:hypothetical protein